MVGPVWTEGSLPRVQLRLAAVAAVLALAGAPTEARAAHLSCGDVLGAGRHVMDSDLVCSAPDFGLELGSGAELDMQGREISFVGGGGTGIRIAGTHARLSRGTIRRANVAIVVDGGGEHRITGMTITDNNDGILFDASSDNAVLLSSITANRNAGIELRDSHRNRFVALKVTDHAGTAMIGGFRLEGSHDNTIAFSDVSRNVCVGIHLVDSSRTTIHYNVVDGTRCNHPAGTGVGIALGGSSTANSIRYNSATRATHDGINVGCRDGCGFSTPSVGADDNVVTDNLAARNGRYGIAEEPGNLRNVYARNLAFGNGARDVALGP
jgi:parallel beta-helix repeat protein